MVFSNTAYLDLEAQIRSPSRRRRVYERSVHLSPAGGAGPVVKRGPKVVAFTPFNVRTAEHASE